jgi:hypothetical protein
MEGCQPGPFAEQGEWCESLCGSPEAAALLGAGIQGPGTRALGRVRVTGEPGGVSRESKIKQDV